MAPLVPDAGGDPLGGLLLALALQFAEQLVEGRQFVHGGGRRDFSRRRLSVDGGNRGQQGETGEEKQNAAHDREASPDSRSVKLKFA